MESQPNSDAKKNNPENPSCSYSGSSKNIGRIEKPLKKSVKMGGGGSSPNARGAGNPPPLASQFAGSTLPADWQPDPNNVSLAEQLGLPVAAQARKFVANAKSKGRVAVDWQADFALWLDGSAQQKPTTTKPEPSARRGPKKLA